MILLCFNEILFFFRNFSCCFAKNEFIFSPFFFLAGSRSAANGSSQSDRSRQRRRRHDVGIDRSIKVGGSVREQRIDRGCFWAAGSGDRSTRSIGLGEDRGVSHRNVWIRNRSVLEDAGREIETRWSVVLASTGSGKVTGPTPTGRLVTPRRAGAARRDRSGWRGKSGPMGSIGLERQVGLAARHDSA